MDDQVINVQVDDDLLLDDRVWNYLLLQVLVQVCKVLYDEELETRCWIPKCWTANGWI
jgi:hypothetical protein